jgi:HlyD family secretion protein
MADLIYRSEALEARARIDGLATAMQTTDTQTRVTMISIAGALALSLVASAYVVVPIEVAGQGILVDRSGELLVPISATSQGFVERLLVEPGDRIATGQPVASLRLPELEAAIDKASRTIFSMENEMIAKDALDRTELRAQTEIFYQKRVANAQRLENLRGRRQSLEDREAAERTLLAKGVTTEKAALDARIAVQQVVEQIAAAENDQKELARQELLAKGVLKRSHIEQLVKLDQARTDLGALQLNMLAHQTLVSPIDGVVAEIGASVGAVITNGQPVVNIVASGSEGKAALSALVYVPLSSGKQVQPGDEVLLAPASYTDSTHDRIRAKVLSVSETPVTEAALKRGLGNVQLAALATHDGPAFAVRVELESDPIAPSGYAWTSGHGPNLQLSRGTPLSASITVERRSLLSLALPALKSLLGLTEKNRWVAHS